MTSHNMITETASQVCQAYNESCFSKTSTNVVTHPDELAAKRQRNAAAAKRCRDKKKELEQARLFSLQQRVNNYEKETEVLRNENETMRKEQAQWKTKEVLFSQVVTKLKSEVQLQKERIMKLEASMMAIRLSHGQQQNLQGSMSNMRYNSMQSLLPLQQQFGDITMEEKDITEARDLNNSLYNDVFNNTSSISNQMPFVSMFSQ